ncbi:pre-mRNA splicing factor [Scheffersomyces amazonensis]|uniref:pre-mRNA splicing factor n=1 Tax=Scheffersomyces amazonensis TaxID=1078765 RepID=UPI00315CBB38
MTTTSTNSNVPPSDISIPNSDIKETIDKTSGYVVKNGSSFEDRLRANNKDGKFDFLDAHHQYYAYYKWKVSVLENGSVKVKSNGHLTTDNNNNNNNHHPVEPETVLVPPRELPFLVDLPMISPVDLDVIKLTALFVARNGDEYATKLKDHEIGQGNKNQFEFLNQSHSLHVLYQKYIDQYKLLIKFYEDNNDNDNDEQVANINQQLKNANNIIDIAFDRSQYELQHKVIEKEKKEKERQLQIQFASIDWQDFSIVGKIEFDAIDEVSELPVPLTREDLIYRSLESKNTDVIKSSKVEEDIVEVTPVTEEVSNIPQAFKGMKIKAAGESRLKSWSNIKSSSPSTERLIKCPITNKLIPESKFDNHLRILLRDPRYKQEQDNYVRKNFTYASNITTDQVFENIQRLVKKRQGTEVDNDENDNESNERKRVQIGPRK